MSETPDPVELDERVDKDAEDLAALLAKRERARPNRWTYLLAIALVLTVGVVAGAWVGRATAPASGPAFPAGGFAAFRGGGGFPGGAGGFPGGGSSSAPVAGGVTAGTVKLVDGQNIYITDSSGATIKVKVGASTNVTAQQPSTLADIAPGSTVIVTGAAGADGTITAKTITQGTLPGAPTVGRQLPPRNRAVEPRATVVNPTARRALRSFETACSSTA